MSRPPDSFWSLPNPKNSLFGPQKFKNDPEFKSKSNVRIEEKIENESFSITWIDPKKDFELTPTPKIAYLGPKSQKWPQN